MSGKYRLEQRLGGGGMAEVFLASAMGAEGFSRRVAIKRILPGYSDNEAFARMFVAEAQMTSQLVHPNIVSVFDFDRDAGRRLFLVMEYVEGKDLDGLMASGPLPFAVTIFIISEVLRGLGYAHDLPVGTNMRGIVHRDVSPHNVLLSWEGAVKVSDFGIAKARSASEATASAFIKGKPAYMSPEQANGQSLDGRSDLFAVGVMLWEMLVGRRLFSGEDTRAMLAAVLFGQIPRPRSLRPDVPKDLERVTMKLLERDLPARYATAEDAIADLLACVGASKAGREQLSVTLAERFPDQARVRQSLMRSRNGAQSGSPEPARVAVSTGPGQWNAAMPSLGALRNAETRVAHGRRRYYLFAIAASAVLLSGVAAFMLVRWLSPPRVDKPAVVSQPALVIADASPAESAASVVATVPRTPDASIAPPTDAGLASPDAAIVMVDAGAALPDAGSRPSEPRSAAKPTRFGNLQVTAFPVLTVYVNKRRYGDSPITIKLPVGKHTVQLRNNETGYA
ncbi:MAG TPA: serine/threonine-protein kinase, partial [Kofleriaceae bacterium]|nr:serine/threonine-protein kinase [Kofleriaceae bacterium]